MKRLPLHRSYILTLGLCGFIAPHVDAMEFGALRPLQTGPIGDSPQFLDIDQFAGEAGVLSSRIWGDSSINSDPDRKVEAAGYKMRVGAGGGWAPSKQFTLTGYLNFSLASDYDENQERATKKTTLDTGLYQHELAFFGVYKHQPLVFGGGIGLLIYGNEDRRFEFKNAGASTVYYQAVSRATMPVLRLFGGISTKQVDATVGVRFFTKGDSTVEARDKEDGTMIAEYDVIRRHPGELHADGILKLGQTSLAGSLSYLLTAQASEQVNEWSVRFNTAGSKIRDTGGKARHSDQFRIGVGGKFEPSKMIALQGGVTYASSFYAEEPFAAVEYENMGGVRLDLGGVLNISKFNGSIQTGYQIESSTSASITDDSRSETQLDATQRYPLAKGDKLNINQGRWDIAVSGGISL
jgi:hypothetical protein